MPTWPPGVGIAWAYSTDVYDAGSGTVGSGTVDDDRRAGEDCLQRRAHMDAAMPAADSDAVACASVARGSPGISLCTCGRRTSLSYGVTLGGQTDESSPFQIATGMAAQFTKSLETKWP